MSFLPRIFGFGRANAATPVFPTIPKPPPPPPPTPDQFSSLVALANAGLAMANAKKTRDAAGTCTGRATRLTNGLTPERMASYLDEFYLGRFRNIAMLWDVMQESDTICAPVAEKRLAKISAEVRDFTVEAADDSPAALAQADFLRAFFSTRIRAEHARRYNERGGLRKAVEFISDAIGKKYSFLAKVWEGEGDALSLTLRFVPLWHFQEETDETLGGYRYCPNPDSTLSSVHVKEEEWVVAVRRRAVMQAAGLAVLLRRLPVQQVARVLEKFGVPTVYGETTATPDSPGWQALYNAILAISSDMSAVVSDGTKINLLESNFRAAALHKTHLDACTMEIVINWLGGELGTVSKSGSGTLAGGAQAQDLDDIIRDDCDWTSDILNEQIATDALARRFPGQPVLARVAVRKPDDTDDKSDMATLKGAVELGARVPASYVHDRFGLPEAAEDEQVLVIGQSSAASGQPPQTATANASGSSSPPSLDVGRSALDVGRSHSRPFPQAVSPSNGRVRDRRPDLDQLAANSLQPVGQAYAALLQPLLERLDEMPADAPAADVSALLDAYEIPEGALDAFAETMAQVSFAAAMMGGEPIRAALGSRSTGSASSSGSPLGVERSALSVGRSHSSSREYAPLPFDEAREFWAAKQMIQEFVGDEFQADLWAQSRVLGFKVAGISSETLLRQAHADLDRAVKGEESAAKVARTLRDKYGLGSFHAETVVRTNVQSAYSWGNWQQLKAPSVVEAFPLLAFDVTEDERTSGICAPLANKAYPREHPIWQSMYPPNHYNCRTTVYPTTAEEAEADGYEVLAADAPLRTEQGYEILPAKEFGGNIGTGKLADAVPAPEGTAAGYVDARLADLQETTA